jgi:hypothetical protein
MCAKFRARHCTLFLVAVTGIMLLQSKNDQNTQLEEQVLQQIDTFPERTTRKLGRTLGVHHSVVGKILKSEHLHPFHYKRVQASYEGGY